MSTKIFHRLKKNFPVLKNGLLFPQHCSGRTSVVFSGIQPTGIPQLGNYLGAVRNWVKLQDEYKQPIFSVVDLHSLTKQTSADKRKRDIEDTVIALLACGIDPKKAIIFQQSDVLEHAELCWVLTCLVSEARLKQVSQWKEKAKNNKSFSFGLIAYPVLMSADVMLYKATTVPVGEDQLQHLELCRDLANLFNKTYETTLFPLCTWLLTESPRVRNLRDPQVKMSKSDKSEKTRINLDDSAETITMKIRQAVTDFTSEVYYSADERPGLSNLIDIHSSLTGLTYEKIQEQARSLNTGQYKYKVSEAIIEELLPIQNRMTELRQNMDYVEKTLTEGSLQARNIAAKTMIEVKQTIGLK